MTTNTLPVQISGRVTSSQVRATITPITIVATPSIIQTALRNRLWVVGYLTTADMHLQRALSKHGTAGDLDRYFWMLDELIEKL